MDLLDKCDLPAASVCHGYPRFPRCKRLAFLQELDRYSVRGADESHVTVAWGTMDGDAVLHERLARRVDVIHLEGEVAEIAPAPIVLRIPVVGELERRRAQRRCDLQVVPCCQVDVGEAAFFAVAPAHLAQTQQLEEGERLLRPWMLESLLRRLGDTIC